MANAMKIVHKAVARDERAWKKQHPGQIRRFPEYSVGATTAKAICKLAEVKPPRMGWEVTVGFDGTIGVAWKLMNKSGRYFLRQDFK